MTRTTIVAASLGIAVLLARLAQAVDPQVTNVRARQLANKTVEVLYDLSGVPAGGATVSVKFSHDSGASYTITPVASALSGDVGSGIASGTNRRIVWSAPSTMPAELYSTTMRAAVTAVDPGGVGQEITVNLPGGVPLVLVKIPHGTFTMGSPNSEPSRYAREGPLHRVTLTQDYYIGRYEVTQRQWMAVMGSNPSYFTSCGIHCPVEHVLWNEVCGGPTGSACTATSFIGKLNAYLGTTKFRLPTEAEWEYAARGGTTGPFSFDTSGNPSWDTGCGTFAEAARSMWWCGNSGFTTHPVGQKQANPYGLFDVHGNVWEWVGDWYGSYPTEAVTDPTGPPTGADRVFRGGSWLYYAVGCRSAYRGYYLPGYLIDGIIGFRVARSQ